MNSLINKAFSYAKEENRPALLTYTVAGDNTKKKSLEILKSIANYADICELGFPHNTPIADGGQIQTSAYRAIKNGIKINDVFSIAKDFKKTKISQTDKDALQVMDLNEEVKWEQIHLKFKELVKKYHPDKNHGNKQFEEKLKKITLAYSQLKKTLGKK